MKKPKLGCFGWFLIALVVAYFIKYPWLWLCLLAVIGGLVWLLTSDKRRESKNRVGGSPRHPSTKSSNGTFGATRYLVQSSADDYLDAVGESFYDDNFEFVRQALGAKVGTEVMAEFRLETEPDNPHSENGCAVAVYCRGKMLAHISEQDNEDFFDLLQTAGGAAYCKGRIYFSPKSNITTNSVRLYVEQPPRFV